MGLGQERRAQGHHTALLDGAVAPDRRGGRQSRYWVLGISVSGRCARAAHCGAGIAASSLVRVCGSPLESWSLTLPAPAPAPDPDPGYNPALLVVRSHKPESKEEELAMLIYDTAPIFSARFEVGAAGQGLTGVGWRRGEGGEARRRRGREGGM